MENHEKLNVAVKRLRKFVVLEHEGLGADEQHVLLSHLKIITAVSNEIKNNKKEGEIK